MALIEKNLDWVETSEIEIKLLADIKSRATPSPKIFELMDDGNNAKGLFANVEKQDVISGAQDSVAFLTKIGFAKQ